MVTALELFRAGDDTAAIARKLKISEPQALKQVSSERSADLGLSSPYRNAPVNLSVRHPASRLIAYAGR